MNKRSKSQVKTTAAASLLALLLAMVLQQNVLQTLFKIGTAQAMSVPSLRNIENDVLNNSPGGAEQFNGADNCDGTKNQSASDVAAGESRFFNIVWQDDACDGAGNGTGIYVKGYDTLQGATTAVNQNGSTSSARVNDVVAGDQKDPSIAMDYNGNFVVAWDGNGNGDDQGIYVRAYKRTFNPDGSMAGTVPLGPSILVNKDTDGEQDHPKVALNFNPAFDLSQSNSARYPQQFVVVWNDEGGEKDDEGIFMQRFNVDFSGGKNPTAVSSTDIPVNAPGTDAQKNPAVAINNFNEALVTWDGPDNTGTNQVWMQGFAPDDSPLGGNVQVNKTSPASDPAIAADKSGEQIDVKNNITPKVSGGKFVIVYKAGTGTSDKIYAKLVSRCTNKNCPAADSELSISSISSSAPAVAMDYLGNFSVVWQQDDGSSSENQNIHIANYDHLGGRIDGGLQVNQNVFSDTNNRQSSPRIAENKYGVNITTWTSVQSPASPPNNPGNLDVRYLFGGTKLFKQGLETAANNLNNNTLTANTVTAIAPNGNHVVVWGAEYLNVGIAPPPDGGTPATAAATVAADGTISAITITSAGSGYTSAPAVSIDAPPGGGLFAQATAALDSNGSVTAITVTNPGAGYNSSGNYRILYSLYDQAGNIIKNNSGQPVFNLPADTVDDSSVQDPSVSFYKDNLNDNGGADTNIGSFVITWIGKDPGSPDGSQTVVYREFDADGTPKTAIEHPVTPPNDPALVSIYYNNQRVSAGYFEDSSYNLLDRFAVDYVEENDTDGTQQVKAAYHLNGNFMPLTLQPADAACRDTCYATGIDLYPSLNANITGDDNIIYTWQYNNSIYAQEAKGAVAIGAPFQVNADASTVASQPDPAFISQTQYVIAWAKCDNAACNYRSIFAKIFDGLDFNVGSRSTVNNDFSVYPGAGSEQADNFSPRVAADAVDGSFLVVWEKNFADVGSMSEIDGKFYNTLPALSSYATGFVINSTRDGEAYVPDAGMNSNGDAIAAWNGNYRNRDTNAISTGESVFQMLNMTTGGAGLPQLPTIAELSITSGGRTLTVPSEIQFPDVTVNTSNSTVAQREIDENPVAGQPSYFQLEDLGSCPPLPTPCNFAPYTVSVGIDNDGNTTPPGFNYTDPDTKITYTIPASDIGIKNYDGNHPGVGTGTCGNPGVDILALRGNSTDFTLDPSTCNDFMPLDSQQTLLKKITNTSDTAKIQLFPALQINVPPLTPPGTYTGTITITVD
jgi:hypothetical protein